MLNNINTQNTNNNNILAAKKINSKADIKRSVGVIPAPDYLPKYSITQKMEETDQFRKNVIYSNYKEKQKKKNFKKALKVLAVTVAGMLVFRECKKI